MRVSQFTSNRCVSHLHFINESLKCLLSGCLSTTPSTALPFSPSTKHVTEWRRWRRWVRAGLVRRLGPRTSSQASLSIGEVVDRLCGRCWHRCRRIEGVVGPSRLRHERWRREDRWLASGALLKHRRRTHVRRATVRMLASDAV